MRLLLEVGVLLLNAVKQAPRRLLLCDLKDAKVIRVGALSIKNATGYYVFRKGVAVLIFLRLIVLIFGAAFFLLHLWPICITFECIITFVGVITFVDSSFF